MQSRIVYYRGNVAAMKISIVTPCLNCERYLDETIESVLSQRGSFDLEYIVADGGSRDGTLDIIKRNEGRLARWWSDTDKGHYDAIAKGFEISTGEIMGWINSDDRYFPWCLDLVARWFTEFPQVRWISTLSPTSLDAAGDIAKVRKLAGFSKRAFLDGVHVGYGGVGDTGATEFIQQESTFWRRSLWNDADGGAVLRRYSLAGDFALWSAFIRRVDPHGVEAPLGAFRVRKNQLSVRNMASYMDQVRVILAEMRQAENYSFSSQPTERPVSYPGKFILKERWDEAESRWVTREHEFTVLQRSGLKTAIFNSVVF